MSNAALVNFAAGETSPKTRGRFDIASFPSSCRKLLNFIPEVQGPARYRPGFKRLIGTHDGVAARMVPFQISSTLSYMLEFTPGLLRVFRNGVVVQTDVATPYVTADDIDNICPTHNGVVMYLTCGKYMPRLLLLTAVDTFSLITPPRVNDPFGVSVLEANKTTVTGISRAPQCVVTVASATGIADSYGYITGIVGLTELNYRLVKFKLLAGTQFYIVDPFSGAYISTTGAGAPWASGGSVNLLTIGAYNDAVNIAAISRGAVTTITFRAGDDPSSGDLAALYYFEGIEGTTELNGKSYSLTDTTPDGEGRPRSILRTAGNNDVDSSAWGAYISGGFAVKNRDLPRVAGFHESRLIYGGTSLRPNTIFGSRAPGDLGDNRFEDFTGGTNDDDAYFFTPSPVNGASDEITWLRGTSNFLAIGALGCVFRASGGGFDDPITPGAIAVRQVDARGGVFNDSPIVDGARAYFIQRGGEALRGLKYNADIDDLEGFDMGLGAEHIAKEGIKKIVLQSGETDILWVLRDDGQLAGVTINAGENVTGWHRHKIAGTNAEVIDVAVLPQAGEADELWAVVKRTVNSTVVYSIEILTGEVTFPDPEDFFTGAANAAADKAKYLNAVYRRQEEYVHLDAAATYNGSDRGVAAAATLTPAAVTGTGIAFTASANVFVAGDVGSELWKKPDPITGVGGGRAVITAYVSATEVTCTITTDFDSASAIPAGDWYFAVDGISGLGHLEGERVAVVTDGAVYTDGDSTSDYPAVIVAAGAITLSDPAAMVHVGLPYAGLLETQNLEMGGQSGPAQAKPRNIVSMAIRFLASLGCQYGTDMYNMTPVVHNQDGQIAGRPAPVFSGIKKLPYSDGWSGDNSEEKKVVVMQRLPQPCTVQFIDVEYNTADEG